MVFITITGVRKGLPLKRAGVCHCFIKMQELGCHRKELVQGCYIELHRMVATVIYLGLSLTGARVGLPHICSCKSRVVAYRCKR